MTKKESLESIITLFSEKFATTETSSGEFVWPIVLRSQNSRAKICVDILATLEDAASYVISSGYVPEEKAGSNGSTK